MNQQLNQRNVQKARNSHHDIRTPDVAPLLPAASLYQPCCGLAHRIIHCPPLTFCDVCAVLSSKRCCATKPRDSESGGHSLTLPHQLIVWVWRCRLEASISYLAATACLHNKAADTNDGDPPLSFATAIRRARRWYPDDNDNISDERLLRLRPTDYFTCIPLFLTADTVMTAMGGFDAADDWGRNSNGLGLDEGWGGGRRDDDGV